MHFSKSKLTAKSALVIKSQKNFIPSSRNMSVSKKSRVSKENIDTKVSALPPSWPFFNATVLPTL